MVTTSSAAAGAVLSSLSTFVASQGYSFQPATKSSFPLADSIFGTLTSDPVVTLGATEAGLNTGGFSATIGGGGTKTAVIAQGGVVSIAGGVGHIFVADGSGVVSTTGAGTVAATNGAYSVMGGAGAQYTLGGTVSALSSGSSAAVLNGGVVYTGGAADTVTGSSGTSTVFAGSGSLYMGNAASAKFVGTATANTVVGGTGADTVYGNGTTYFGGTNANIFAGYTGNSSSASASTVFAGASGAATVQAGSHGDLLFIQGAAARVVSGGGRDTIWGSASTVAPTIFGTSGSYEMMVSTMKGGLALGFGNNTTLDGANTTGGTTYYANPGMGNQTFIGSATGNDSFYIGTQNVGTSLIEIRGWHTGDAVNLSAFGATDRANALAAVKGGASLFKLSNGTTVSFVGGHPTGGNGQFLT